MKKFYQKLKFIYFIVELVMILVAIAFSKVLSGYSIFGYKYGVLGLALPISSWLFTFVLWSNMINFLIQGNLTVLAKKNLFIAMSLSASFLLINLPLNFRLFFVYFIVFFSMLQIGLYLFLKKVNLKIVLNKKVLIIGKNKKIKQIIDHLTKNRFFKYNIIGYVTKDETVNLYNDYQYLGSINDLSLILERENIDIIISNLSQEENPEDLKLINDVVSYMGKELLFIPDYNDILGTSYKIDIYGGLPFINTRYTPLNCMWRDTLKRIFDIVFSSFALLCLSPIFLVIAILIKLDSKGPVLYTVQRMGRNGNAFKLYKFRTMIENANACGTKSTSVDDDRITRVGKILRRTSIDEVPQFINVFLGDMSVIGPRPHRIWLDNQLQNSVPNYMNRYLIKPGITGWAQVNGWRGPTVTQEQKEQRVLHDLWYLENWSFFLDLKIVYLTIFGRKVRHNAF